MTPSQDRPSTLCRMAGLLLGLIFSTTCSAQMALPTAAIGSDWSLRAGASVLTLPRYPGAEKMRIVAFPDFEVRYRDLLFADPIRGVGIVLRPAEGLELRASIGLAPDIRRIKDDTRFQGLEDIGQRAALNLGATYKFDDAFVESTVRSRLAGKDQAGTTLEGSAGYNVVATSSTQLGLGVIAKAMDKRYANTFFSITPRQATASGLSAYQADGGLQSAGLFAQINHQIDRSWLFTSHVESLRLRGDAASSPVTRRKQQTLFIVSLLRSF